MAAWPIKFTEGSKSGKKHPLPIDLSTENKKAKRSAYEKERRPGIRNGNWFPKFCINRKEQKFLPICLRLLTLLTIIKDREYKSQKVGI
jgi:hypothetical protein